MDVSALEEKIRTKTSVASREWEKVSVFCQQKDYLAFLCQLTGKPERWIRGCLEQFQNDVQFRGDFQPKLQEFEASNQIVHGDVRFHSLSLYTLVRARRPEWIVETGVASGKSSALILLALHHNAKGRLISIDLPNPPGQVLKDGASTHTGGKSTGWLVPTYLRERWELLLGDARHLLPDAVLKIPEVDLFLHDSLHLVDHLRFELEAVEGKLHREALILVHDADLLWQPLEQFLKARGWTGYVYRNLAGIRMNGA